MPTATEATSVFSCSTSTQVGLAEEAMLDLVGMDGAAEDLKRSLAAADYCLKKTGYGAPILLTVCGRSAAILKGYTRHETYDIDVIDNLSPEVLLVCEAFGINNQAGSIFTQETALRLRATPLNFPLDVLRVSLVSDADLLCMHLNRGLQKDVMHLVASKIIQRVKYDDFLAVVQEYPRPEIIKGFYLKLRQLGGHR